LHNCHCRASTLHFVTAAWVLLNPNRASVEVVDRGGREVKATVDAGSVVTTSLILL